MNSAIRIASASLIATIMTLGPIAASACGTLAPALQEKIDQANLQAEREAATRKILASDLILVGTVSALQRPDHAADSLGRVTLNVSETLKGPPSGASTELSWKSVFVLSCEPADMFDNVGFAENQGYIVYVSDARITRSASTAPSAYAGKLSFGDERKMVLDPSGK